MLVKCARCNSIQRRYLKQQVLPPLRDVKTRPEVGDHLRNRLVKLLTTPATQVRDLAADFLFVLCKENGNWFFRHISRKFFILTISGTSKKSGFI